MPAYRASGSAPVKALCGGAAARLAGGSRECRLWGGMFGAVSHVPCTAPLLLLGTSLTPDLATGWISGELQFFI